MLVFYACLLPGIAAANSSYSSDKIGTAFTFGLLASVAPLFLLRREAHIGLLYWITSAIGALAAVLALTGNISVDYGRYAVLNTNTTGTGEIIGLALIWVVVLVVARRIHIVIALAVAAGLGIAMVGTGARGPLLSAIAAIVVATAFGSGARKRPGRRLFVLASVIAILVVGYQSAPHYSQTRLLTVGDVSGQYRLGAYSASWQAIPTHPLGVGWGNWADFVGPDVAQDQLYPHDLILEVFLEGGWIAGIGLLWFLFRVGRSAFRRSDGPIGRATLALFLFYLIENLLSGDLVDARVLFAICSVVLVREAIARARRPEVPDPYIGGKAPEPRSTRLRSRTVPGSYRRIPLGDRISVERLGSPYNQRTGGAATASTDHPQTRKRG